MLSTMSKPAVSHELMTKVLLEPKILVKILHCLDTNSLLASRYVCRTWHSISNGPLQQRLTLERTASVYLEGSPNTWPSDFVSRWFRLMVLEWDERPATDEELAIESDADIGLNIYSPCPGLLSFLPESVWAERISVLCFDHSLTVQDWNESGCLLVSGLRSLRRLDMRFGQFWGIWDSGMNFGSYFSDNDVIEEVHVKLDDGVFCEATKDLFGVFDMMFLGYCPKLQRLSLDLENHLRVYREMMTASCNRIESGQWSVELFSKLAEDPDDDHALQTELRAMFAYIPVEELAVKLISGVDPVLDIVATGSTSLKKLKIDCSRVRYGFNLIANLFDKWSRIPVFSSVVELALEFRDDENRIGMSVPFCLDDPIDDPVESYGDMSSLANVIKLELVHQQVNHWDCDEVEGGTEAAAVGHSLKKYWTEVLRYVPNVQILVTAAAARCQFLQAMSLPKLRHVVLRQGFHDVIVHQPNTVFIGNLQKIVAHLRGLRSFTLDFEEDPDWGKSSNFAPYYIAIRMREVLVGFAGNSPLRLVQINSPFLINVELKPESAETADIEVRVFNGPHGLLYDCFRNEPVHAFDANVEYPDFDMMPELQPATIAYCNERNAGSF